MFKREVERHDAKVQSKTLSQQLFPSSSPNAPQESPSSIVNAFKSAARPVQRPLSTVTGNVNRHTGPSAPFKKPTVASHGVKRTSSGLAKALNNQTDAFGYPSLPQEDTKENHGIRQAMLKEPATKAAAATFFDENDFDSDIDLDTEDPTEVTTIQYPNLPNTKSREATGAFASTKARPAPLSPKDSGYETQPPTWVEPRHTESSQPVPWSSSPVEHFEPPSNTRNISRFRYKPGELHDTHNQPDQPKARPTKRRTLPWLQEEEEARKKAVAAEEEDARLDATSQRRRATTGTTPKADFTPLPKDKSLPWNTTASAIKQQQKNLRQANKKMVKTNEATDETKQEAIATKKKNTVSKVFLSEEQQHVLHLVIEQKRSVFFTGSAGTGKSVLLREIIAGLRRKYAREPDRIAVTASTGLAACNVGGVTLHSFAGIGLGKEAPEDLVKKIRRNQKARHRWMRTKVLIVDEVSMVDGELFDKLEQIARTIRNNGRPFGGIQLVITGDFFQLPPVPEHGRASRFSFDAGTWNTCIEHTIALHHVFRQKDPVFANMLNEMREGRMSSESIAAFRRLERPIDDPHSDKDERIDATELFPTRNEVDRANHVRMHELPGDTRVFEAKDGGTIVDKAMRDKLLQNCMASESVALKKGAQVMLIKNIDDTLVNGSLGKVIGFMSEATFDKYHANEDEFHEIANAEIENLNPAQQREKKRMDLLASTATQYPLVRFAIADGTTRDLLCQRESWKVELPNGEVQASRSQIPLILAWALSIHKAQGQTLERVKVDLGKVFEKGQAYVALSRATSMQGLQVLRFDPRKVLAHEKVRSFYNSLSRAGGEVAGEDAGKKGPMDKMKKWDSVTMTSGSHEKGFADSRV